MAKDLLSQDDFNHLIHSTSPYLVQHAKNPVHWYPWGPEAFQKARQDNKPIFLSIGYSTCHWCHVMAHESFEDLEIAGLLNENFVSIKVDREERPDIDNIYMKAVMAITGQSGWPLSVFLTTELKPFFGGTYFPADPKWGMPSFKDLLLSIIELWQRRQYEVIDTSQTVAQALERQYTLKSREKTLLNKKILEDAYNRFSQNFDPHYGGFGPAPKFPTGHSLSFLLRYGYRTQDLRALEMVEKTLLSLASGGIHDQLGGGFHRYSTDPYWQLPHFEKMLYDQAILSRVFLEAYQITQKEIYAQVARGIFEYVLRDLQGPRGGFFCAQDADSFASGTLENQEAPKAEGLFYLWTYQEVQEILAQDQWDILCYSSDLKPEGNVRNDPLGEFKGKNILYVAHDSFETANHFKISPSQIDQILKEAKKNLLTQRLRRKQLHLDDKILVDWNGLMIASLALGARVLGEERYLKAAQQSADLILKKMVTSEGRLLHRYHKASADIKGTIDDYAFFIEGLIELYETTFEIQYLQSAKKFTEEMLELFWDKRNGGFFFTGKDAERLFVRSKESYDGALPSGNSVATRDLIILSRLLMVTQWEKTIRRVFKSVASEVVSFPSGYTQMLMNFDLYNGPSQEVVIVGKKDTLKVGQLLKKISQNFLPDLVVLLKSPDVQMSREIDQLVLPLKNYGSNQKDLMAYICKNFVCQEPTGDVKRFEELLGI